MRNTSTTESIYGFCEVVFDSSVWSFSPGDGWTEVESGVYAYGSETMTPIAIGDTFTLTGTLTVIADGASFGSLTNDDAKVQYKAYGIGTAVSRSAPGDAWEDYGIGGNSEMLEAVGG